MSAEASVRVALREHLLAPRKRVPTAVDEFWVPQSNERADLALIGGDLSGYEIKTERDTLRRLPRQAAAYGRVFDRCTVVIGPRHTSAAVGLLPEWWGVVEVSVNGHVSFDQIRMARQNSDVDPETLVRLLWRSEVQAALARLNVEVDPSATRGTMWRLLLERADVRELRMIVRRALRQRNGADARIPSRRFRQAASDDAN
jgi:hypothetical protein